MTVAIETTTASVRCPDCGGDGRAHDTFTNTVEAAAAWEQMHSHAACSLCRGRGTVPAPDPAGSDWIDFLHWFADRGANVIDLIHLIEKPHQHGTAYSEYLAEGGVDR